MNKPALTLAAAVAGLMAWTQADANAPVPVSGAAPAFAAAPAADSSAHSRIVSGYGKLPLSFEPNVGQAAAPVKYLSQGNGYSIDLTERGAILKQRGSGGAEPAAPTRLRLSLVNAKAQPRLRAEQAQDSVSNYFVGSDPSKWHSRVANYGAVRYEQVYPGIDWLVYGNPQQLEYDLVVAPQADPRQIRLRIEGADRLALDRNGDLLLQVRGQTLRQLKPAIYQTTAEGGRQAVEGRYRLDREHGQVAFVVGDYDHGRALVIDPVLAYSSYLDGTANAIAVDSAGEAYVAGSNLGGDAFVIKLNAAGDALLYSTHLGGSGGDSANAIAIDSAGDAYITGRTGSTDFPTVNPFQGSTSGPGGTAFVAKLGPDGSTLLYSTYLGGTGGSCGDTGTGIAIDNSGNAYVTGYTDSTNFPTINPLQAANHGGGNRECGGLDAFVSKFNAAGSALLYSTYLGGTGDEHAYAIAVDGSGNAYVAGATESADFPAVNPLQASHAVVFKPDAFISKLNAAGSALTYSTPLGGDNADYAFALAVDSAGEAYVAGSTGSQDFPTVNPLQQPGLQDPPGYPRDAFVSKLTAAGNALVYSSFVGGSFDEVSQALALDSGGSVYIAGFTSSIDFPTVNPVQSANASKGFKDAFVTRINAAGSARLFSTYLGGTADERTFGIAVDGSGNIYIVGTTQSPDFPTVNPVQGTAGGSFIAKISPAPAAPTGVTATAGNAQVSLGWTAVGDASSYNVYQGTTAGGEATVPVLTGIATNTTTITGLSNGTAYFFKISAVNASAEGPKSAEVSTTPTSSSSSSSSSGGGSSSSSSGSSGGSSSGGSGGGGGGGAASPLLLGLLAAAAARRRRGPAPPESARLP